ncbi:hypothetical protein EDD11_005807 [Mortierella claussenii]|nr:hypothetical protein EDD11_005807 [Mortierella claussenii]
MPKRGGKQQQHGSSAGGRGGRGGGRGGRGGRGSGRGYNKGERQGGYGGDIGLYDDDDDYLSFTGRNHQRHQRSTEEEVYHRIQQAKADRGGNDRMGRVGAGTSSGYRANGSPNGYRPPPPPPKQNGNGKNSKHFFWPPPSNYNDNNDNNNNSNTQLRVGSSNSSQRGRARNVLFNRATPLTDSSMLRSQNDDDSEDDADADDVAQDGNCEDESEADSSDDLISRGVDSDDDSDEEFLMQQFNWIEEDHDQMHNGTFEQQQHQLAQKKKQRTVQKSPAAADILTACMEPLSISAMDTAMTQSEDFMQAMEAEGDIKVHADEIENLSRSLSDMGPMESVILKSTKSQEEQVEVYSARTVEFSEDGLILESHTEVAIMDISTGAANSNNSDGVLARPELETANPTSALTPTEKPKKKAHRSKRGGKNQRERQMNKQLIVGNDDDGPMYLEDASDDEDEEMVAMEDYLLDTCDAKSLDQLESLLGALKGLHTSSIGHSKSVGGIDPDDSDYEQQASELDSDEEDDYEKDDYDFEEDYEDGIKKLDFSKVTTSVNDKRKNRKVDDLLRDELQNLLPLWQAGALQDGDGGNRRFKSRAKGYEFYDSDDDFITGGKKKNNGKNKNKNRDETHGGSFESLVDINRQIENFVKDRHNDSLQLAPMPKPLRRKVHLLCNHYNLKSQSVGSGKRRFPILIKTDRTKMPINPVNVNKLLNQSEKELTLLSAQFQGSRKGGFGGGGGKGGYSGGNGGGGKGKGKGRSAGSGTMAVHGTVVGASASAISVENVGHRMLSKMGWCPGVGLGATGDGIVQPIEAIVRAKNRGLGHE